MKARKDLNKQVEETIKTKDTVAELNDDALDGVNGGIKLVVRKDICKTTRSSFYSEKYETCHKKFQDN